MTTPPSLAVEDLARWLEDEVTYEPNTSDFKYAAAAVLALVREKVHYAVVESLPDSPSGGDAFQEYKRNVESIVSRVLGAPA